MVCDFGLSPEGTSWLVSTSATGLKRLNYHTANTIADRALPWWKSTDAVEIHNRKNKAMPTGFADGDDNKGVNDNKGVKKEKTDDKKGGGSCFPPSATVYVKKRGPIRMVDLKIGDLVLVGNATSSSLTFSPFIGYLHHEASVVEDYLEIETSMDSKLGSHLQLSKEHLIFAASSQNGEANAVRADNLRKGDWLCRASCDGDLQRAQISMISEVQLVGRFCPLTQSGTVIVESCLCSCYVDAGPFMIENAPAWLRRLGATQEVVHSVFLPLRLSAGLGLQIQDGRDAEDSHECQHKGIHPYLQKLMMLPGVGAVV